MKSRRTIVHVLLSLLLLFSQQMAISHGIAHWSGSRGKTTQVRAQPAGQLKVAKSLALDQTCDQCLAFAQIGSALGTPTFAFFASTNTDSLAITVSAQPDCRRTVCVFRSRAPPAFT